MSNLNDNANTDLATKEITLVTYVWIDGKQGLRSKTRTLNFRPTQVSQIPLCAVDGSFTYQCVDKTADYNSSSDLSAIYLAPVRLYRDPFHVDDKYVKNILALCETISYIDRPTPTPDNRRNGCNKTMKLAARHQPWFGVEQEYFFLDARRNLRPLGWPRDGNAIISSYEPYHCGIGAGRVCGRQIADLHVRACLYAGVKIDGANAEGVMGQWEYQVGPCEGVTIADDLWISRYILHRIAEDFDVAVTFDPLPVTGFLGSGAHTNFSTAEMRTPKSGIDAIQRAIMRLERSHAEHMVNYDLAGGADNARRLVNGFVTASSDKFTSGIGLRSVSVRIPQAVANAGCGYLEDRRPASNMDPYVVCELIVRNVCLDNFSPVR